MRSPVNPPYRVTLKYGATSPPYSATNKHNGVDLVSDDRKIVAPEAGTVTAYYDTKGKSGWMMVFQGKYRHTFSHTVASSNKVPVGTKASEGQHLATMGATGFVTGVHIHWVVNSGSIDPMLLISKEDDMTTSREDAIWIWRTVKQVHSPTDAQKLAYTGKNLTKLLMDLNDDGDVAGFRDTVKTKYPALLKENAALKAGVTKAGALKYVQDHLQ